MPAYQTSGFAYQGAGQFAYQTTATSTTTTTGGGGRYRVFGYVPESRPHITVAIKGKKRKKEIAYVSIEVPMADYSGVMEELAQLQELLAQREYTMAQVRKKIEEFEEEQDILFIVRSLDDLH